MCSNYFEKLRVQARKLDDSGEKLFEKWKLSHVYVGRFTGCTEETNSHVEKIWDSIRSTQAGVKEILSEIKEYESQTSISMEEFLQEAEEKYKTLKHDCDGLYTVLSEYGYHYDGNDSLDQTNANCSTESNEHPAIKVEDLEVEFTPDLSWKCKVKSSEPSTPAHNGNCVPRGIATPVITSLASVIEAETSIRHKDYAIYTPLRERPQQPIYSKHFYSAFRK